MTLERVRVHLCGWLLMVMLRKGLGRNHGLNRITRFDRHEVCDVPPRCLQQSRALHLAMLLLAAPPNGMRFVLTRRRETATAINRRETAPSVLVKQDFFSESHNA